MNNKIKIAVIGGTGKSGKYLVKELIAQGFQLKILLRNPDNFQTDSPLVEVVKGNVTSYSSVNTLLKGCHAIISTLGLGNPPSDPTIFSQATAHVIQVMNEQNIHRYILTTGLNVDTPSDKKTPQIVAATNWMKEKFPVSTADKQLEFDILSKSNIEWTLVRLPLIEQTNESGDLIVSLEDCPGDKIRATDLAKFLIKQLFTDRFVRKSPFIVSI